MNNDVHVFGRKCPSNIIMSIKIVSLQDQILLLLQLKDRDISRLTSHPSSHLQSLLMYMQTFYLEVESFVKMEINLLGKILANDI